MRALGGQATFNAHPRKRTKRPSISNDFNLSHVSSRTRELSPCAISPVHSLFGVDCSTRPETRFRAVREASGRNPLVTMQRLDNYAGERPHIASRAFQPGYTWVQLWVQLSLHAHHALPPTVPNMPARDTQSVCHNSVGDERLVSALAQHRELCTGTLSTLSRFQLSRGHFAPCHCYLANDAVRACAQAVHDTMLDLGIVLAVVLDHAEKVNVPSFVKVCSVTVASPFFQHYTQLYVERHQAPAGNKLKWKINFDWTPSLCKLPARTRRQIQSSISQRLPARLELATARDCKTADLVECALQDSVGDVVFNAGAPALLTMAFPGGIVDIAGALVICQKDIQRRYDEEGMRPVEWAENLSLEVLNKCDEVLISEVRFVRTAFLCAVVQREHASVMCLNYFRHTYNQ